MNDSGQQLATILEDAISGAPSTARMLFKDAAKKAKGRKAAKALQFESALNTYAGVLAALAVVGQVLPAITTILACNKSDTLDSLTEELAKHEYKYVAGDIIRFDPVLLDKATGLGYLTLRPEMGEQSQQAALTMANESIQSSTSLGPAAAVLMGQVVWLSLAEGVTSTWGPAAQGQIRTLAGKS